MVGSFYLIANTIREINRAKDKGGDAQLVIDVSYDDKYFTKEAKDLLEKIFVEDPMKRLGANGIDEIKDHPFFKPINWNRLTGQLVRPPFGIFFFLTSMCQSCFLNRL